MDFATVDFETDKIQKYPAYPPKPVGVAIEYGNKKIYLAWGHPEENNSSIEEAATILKFVFANYIVIFHNAPFDILVAMVHLGLKRPIAFEDTLYLAYLYDPRDKSLALKPLADKYLNMPPDEQTELKNWIMDNLRTTESGGEGKVINIKKHMYNGKLHAIPNKVWGAFISYAPGKLVGRYAIGDIVRTKKLFKFYYSKIVDAGMRAAYEREKKLTYITMNMTDVGTRVAVKKLEIDCELWKKEIILLDKQARKILKCGNDINLNSDAELADALDKAKMVTHWIMTDGGSSGKSKRSTSRPNLLKVCKDKKLLGVLSRKGSLETYLNTFGIPWLSVAQKDNGYIHPSFNQTRSNNEYGKGGYGTRTGRLSSSDPNLQNVPDVEKLLEQKLEWAVGLPNMRDYLIPDIGCVLNGRDYSQQELRMLASYAGGELLKAYRKNPRMDIHVFVQELIKRITGYLFERKAIKGINFGIIYGMGIELLAIKCGIDEAMAKILKKAHAQALPEVEELNKILKKAARNDEPIYTWGGRRYYVEDSVIKNGREISYEYKQLNYLIQGSSADVTKEAMIRVAEACVHSRLTIQVHDELLMNSDKAYAKKEMELMREAMESIECEVLMLSDGKFSAKSWGEMK